MKLEFLNDISDGGRFPDAYPKQLIRFYDFDILQAKVLCETIRQVIVENKRELNFATLDLITPVNCSLIFTISTTDVGVTNPSNNNFLCTLTVEKYQEMILLISPFCDKETKGYQWLYDFDTPIALLFSPGGSW